MRNEGNYDDVMSHMILILCVRTSGVFLCREDSKTWRNYLQF